MLVGGEKFEVEVPTIPSGDLPQGAVKLCEPDDINHLIGKLKTFIETIITNEIQLKSSKDLLNDICWGFWQWLDCSCDGTTYKLTAFLQQLKNKHEIVKGKVKP